MAYIQRIPLITANEDIVLVGEWTRKENDYVQVGDWIATLETTKAIFDVEAEADGYLHPIIPAGEYGHVGEVLAVIKETLNESIKEILAREEQESSIGKATGMPTDRRWTRKAEILARKLNIDISKIPSDGIIKEEQVRNYWRDVIGKSPGPESKIHIDFQHEAIKKKLLILGGGRGAVQTIDALHRSDSYEIVGILDDNQALFESEVLGYNVLGPISMVKKLWEEGSFEQAIISFSTDIESRANLYYSLKEQGIPFANVVDNNVSIHSNVQIGEGNLIMSFCRLGSFSRLGCNNFLSAYVNIEHHCRVGDCCTFGPGVFLSSRVDIGDRVKFGTGIFIEPGICIGEDTIIASGSVITSDIPPRSLVKSIVMHRVRRRH